MEQESPFEYSNASDLVDKLRDLISDFHHELGMTVYSVEDTGAASDIARTADRLWDKYCKTISEHSL